MPRPVRKSSHHHGNLREALVTAGVQLLEDGGPAALTLRGCAALAGVSHAAPAHHFDGLDGLKLAIAEEGFRRFRNYMVDAKLAGPQNARARLRSICRGYLRFAADNPALFDLIFGFDPTRTPPDSRGDIGSAGYEVLRRTCAPLVPPGCPDPALIEVQVWSLIHGFTTLYLSGRFRDHAQEPDAALFEAVLGLIDRIGTPS